MAGTPEKLYLFYKNNCFLSNFYPSTFIVENVTFLSVEQYFQYEKAKLFKDVQCMEKIMQKVNPKDHKSLGNRCKNFQEEKWNAASTEMMKKGLMAKFQQNAHLREKLLATKGLYLAEASATDCKWGIGYSLNDFNARNPSKWRGQNLLGELLMEVRDDLL